MKRINLERNDVHLAVISDQSEFIRQSINSVRSSTVPAAAPREPVGSR
jgi:multidrug efflux pump subunit AcrB